jgi:hypothetical protein
MDLMYVSTIVLYGCNFADGYIITLRMSYFYIIPGVQSAG